MKKVRFYLVSISLVLCATSLLSACAGGHKSTAVTEAVPVQEQMNAELGVEIVALRQTAAGHMLDLRYRVLDREKAMDLFREDLEPVIIHERTGKRLAVPVGKLGPMRQTSRNPEIGRTYFMFFGNPRGFVRSGDMVTLIIGKHRIEHLVVE